jgi:hypothetical protein
VQTENKQLGLVNTHEAGECSERQSVILFYEHFIDSPELGLK